MTWIRGVLTARAHPSWNRITGLHGKFRPKSCVPSSDNHAIVGFPPLSTKIPLVRNAASVAVSQAHSATELEMASGERLDTVKLKALVDQFRDEAPKEVVTWMTQALGQIEEEQRARSALLKRSWSDSPFEHGEAENEKTIEGFELELVGMLKKSNHGLADCEILGNAIDLAGAYKKNYKLEQSEAVLLRCTRHAEDRSGAWMVKYLNHISQVRMKQRRNVEALEMMYEIELLAYFSLDEPGASSFYETLYRNISSCLRSMGKEDEAAVYFMKMAEATRYHKQSLDWMDLWDLGVLLANRAFHSERWSEFYKSREILAEALRLQHVFEPHELILRAKVLSNLGQCYLATGEHDEAEKHYSEAYDLFNKTVGKRSPLFGMQAWACGNLRCAQGMYKEALPYLGEALYVEVVSDGLSISEITKLLDQILGSCHQGQEMLLDSADVEKYMGAIKRSLDTLMEDPRWHQHEETLELGVVAHKAALIYVMARWNKSSARRISARYNLRAIDVLNQHSDRHEAKQWLIQAEAVHHAVLNAH